MDAFAAKLDEIEKTIYDEAMDAMARGEIREAEVREIADFSLENLKEVKDQASLIKFLKRLSFNWTMFEKLLQIEEGQIGAQEEAQAVKEMVEHINAGNIDEALDTAKKVLE